MENFGISLIQTGNAGGSFEVAYNGNTMGPTGILDTDDTYDGDNDAYSTNVIASPVTGTVEFVITVDPTALPRTSRWDNILLTGDIVSASGSTLSLSGFVIDPTTGVGEVSLRGAASTAYILVEADDLDFSNPDQSPVTLTGATVGTVLSDQVTTDANGDATVQFDLGGAKPATFIRAESVP